MFEQLTSLHEGHNKINTCRFGKHVVHWNDKGVPNLEQYQFLNFQRLKGVVLNHNVFSYRLHRIKFLRLLMLYQVYFAERSSSN